MDKWWDFYRDLFNFKQIHFFDIEGKLTGLVSRAITSPCGRIRIPLNESTDDKSQIEEFLRKYNGEGIQHIAVGTDDIYASHRLDRRQRRQVHARPAGHLLRAAPRPGCTAMTNRSSG
jgi:4-hydroxyphenylpyruvate dioxygenase